MNLLNGLNPIFIPQSDNAYQQATANMSQQIARFTPQLQQGLANQYAQQAQNLQIRAQMQAKLLEQYQTQQSEMQRLKYTQEHEDERARLSRENAALIAQQNQMYHEQMENMREESRQKLEAYKLKGTLENQKALELEKHRLTLETDAQKAKYAVDKETQQEESKKQVAMINAVHSMYTANLERGLSPSQAWNQVVDSVGKYAGFQHVVDDSGQPAPAVAAEIGLKGAQQKKAETDTVAKQQEIQFANINQLGKNAAEFGKLQAILGKINDEMQPLLSSKNLNPQQQAQLDFLNQQKKQNIALQGILGAHSLALTAQEIRNNPQFANTIADTDPATAANALRRTNPQLAAHYDQIAAAKQPPPQPQLGEGPAEENPIVSGIGHISPILSLIPGPQMPFFAAAGAAQFGSDIGRPMLERTGQQGELQQDKYRNLLKAHPEILKKGIPGIYDPAKDGKGVDSFIQTVAGRSAFGGGDTEVDSQLKQLYPDYGFTPQQQQKSDVLKQQQAGGAAIGTAAIVLPLAAGSLLRAGWMAAIKNPAFAEGVAGVYNSAPKLIQKMIPGWNPTAIQESIAGVPKGYFAGERPAPGSQVGEPLPQGPYPTNLKPVTDFNFPGGAAGGYQPGGIPQNIPYGQGIVPRQSQIPLVTPPPAVEAPITAPVPGVEPSLSGPDSFSLPRGVIPPAPPLDIPVAPEVPSFQGPVPQLPVNAQGMPRVPIPVPGMNSAQFNAQLQAPPPPIPGAPPIISNLERLLSQGQFPNMPPAPNPSNIVASSQQAAQVPLIRQAMAPQPPPMEMPTGIPPQGMPFNPSPTTPMQSGPLPPMFSPNGPVPGSFGATSPVPITQLPGVAPVPMIPRPSVSFEGITPELQSLIQMTPKESWPAYINQARQVGLAGQPRMIDNMKWMLQRTQPIPVQKTPPTQGVVEPQGTITPELNQALQKIPKNGRKKMIKEVGLLKPQEQLQLANIINRSFVV